MDDQDLRAWAIERAVEVFSGLVSNGRPPNTKEIYDAIADLADKFVAYVENGS